MTSSVVAVDLGATSGRVIHAIVGADSIHHDVVHRFPNGPLEASDGLHWGVRGLFDEISRGLALIAQRADQPVSMGIDSWAVDYGLLRQGELLWEPFHYRDSRTARGVERVHAKRDHAGLFARNGLQFLPFNTVYQLASEDWAGASGDADCLLLIPDLIGFWLSGQVLTEYTNASTTGLVNVSTGQFDDELIALSGAPSHLLAPLVAPGTVVGAINRSVFPAADLPLVTVGSHDTASAVVGTPLEGETSAYISCGTWGLVGLEVATPILSDRAREANFTNEGGVGDRVRFLTNVMGLWMLNESVNYWRENGSSETVESLVAKASDYRGPITTIDVSDPVFMPPGNMPQRIIDWAISHDQQPPANPVAMVASIVASLATAFAIALNTASELANQPIRQINITGGGSQNRVLCQMLADQSGLPVIAGPTEATAIGNVLVQAQAMGLIGGGLEGMRQLLRLSVETTRYLPRPGMETVS